MKGTLSQAWEACGARDSLQREYLEALRTVLTPDRTWPFERRFMFVMCLQELFFWRDCFCFRVFEVVYLVAQSSLSLPLSVRAFVYIPVSRPRKDRLAVQGVYVRKALIWYPVLAFHPQEPV